MLSHLALVIGAALSDERDLEIQNNQIFQSLKTLADSNHFSKIKMSFNDKCPLEGKKCSQTSCTVHQIEFQGKEGYIDLLSVKESYSKVSNKKGSNSSIIWKEIYKLGDDNEMIRKMISGLHYSVTTHLSAFHTKLFNSYYSHPLLFRKRVKREYKDNYVLLYKIVKLAVANLSTMNADEIPESAKKFSFKLRRALSDERYKKKRNNSLYQNNKGGKKSLLEKDNLIDVEQKGESAFIEPSSTEDFKESLPRIDASVIDILNQFPKHLACLECQKCKLWGTIQVKGLKAAVKALNGLHLYKNEVIFLINLFRQLSITMIESKKLEEKRWAHLNLVIICHREILLIIAGILLFTLIIQKVRRTHKEKME